MNFGRLTRCNTMRSEESLPNEILPEAEYKAEGSRYDGQIAVFGRAVHESLTQLNTFLVGAGALGCEFLKNLALMGVATGARPANLPTKGTACNQ